MIDLLLQQTQSSKSFKQLFDTKEFHLTRGKCDSIKSERMRADQGSDLSNKYQFDSVSNPNGMNMDRSRHTKSLGSVRTRKFDNNAD